jgi:hypothetical protein
MGKIEILEGGDSPRCMPLLMANTILVPHVLWDPNVLQIFFKSFNIAECSKSKFNSNL